MDGRPAVVEAFLRLNPIFADRRRVRVAGARLRGALKDAMGSPNVELRVAR
jgi:hypothetical protein